MQVSIETLTETDLDATDDVLRLAYKTSHRFHPQLRRYLAIQPGGAFVARTDGRVIGFGGAIDYGAFSYIGLIGVHPELQRKGVGRAIFERVTTWLQARGCGTVLLDASPDGAPLYEHLGYEDEDTTLVLERREPGWETSGRSGGVAPLSEGDMPRLVSFDSPSFGARRGAVLRSYWSDNPDRFIVSFDQTGEIAGYLVAQPRALGPWIAADADVAERLLLGALHLTYESEGPQVFVSGSNSEALRLLDKFGFKRLRSLRHMRKGVRIQRERRTRIYGQASLGFG